jgi:glutathione S-transferase
VRYVLYAKNLESKVDIVPPSTLGGLKSPAFLALHPLGKMPVLLLPDGTAVPESEARCCSLART